MNTIYFIGDEHGRIKIGFTTLNVAIRLSMIQSHNADKLTLLATEKGNELREGQLHAHFSHLWIRGEWYWAFDELLDYIITLDDALLLTQWVSPIPEELIAQRIIREAKAEAQRIVQKAKTEAQQRIAQQRIVKEAKAKAQRIIWDAEIKAKLEAYHIIKEAKHGPI